VSPADCGEPLQKAFQAVPWFEIVEQGAHQNSGASKRRLAGHNLWPAYLAVRRMIYWAANAGPGMNKPIGDVKPYLDYLDKEMTIQGILSAFCVATIGLVLDKVLGADPKIASLLSTILMRGFAFVMLGSIAMALAALLFYLQRSYLARTYGDVASAAARNAAESSWEPLPLADEIDWSSYQCGFAALTVAVFEYALVLACRLDLVAAHRVWWGSGPILMGLLGLRLSFSFGAMRSGPATFAEWLGAGLGKSGRLPAPREERK
jgi:hypothetical protein